MESYTEEQIKKLCQSFEIDVAFSRKSGNMIWGKDLDGIEIYALPVTSPDISFKLVNCSNKNELIKYFEYNKSDTFYVWNQLMNIARLFKHYIN